MFHNCFLVYQYITVKGTLKVKPRKLCGHPLQCSMKYSQNVMHQVHPSVDCAQLKLHYPFTLTLNLVSDVQL